MIDAARLHAGREWRGLRPDRFKDLTAGVNEEWRH
jgi:hypothetical protein